KPPPMNRTPGNLLSALPQPFCRPPAGGGGANMQAGTKSAGEQLQDLEAQHLDPVPRLAQRELDAGGWIFLRFEL
ncbi:MAG TPA: hypothetical protein PKE47_13540, partial [Verrucomicrobiota bacterium]|nr:hypothetical protein [Verrucomicrobiota bacterium]